jgi:hypothetical protein
MLRYERAFRRWLWAFELHSRLPRILSSMTKQHIIDEIKRTAKANGGEPLGVRRFLTETGIKESDWKGRFWIRWSDAVREAGFEANQKQVAIDEKLLLERLVALIRELGHFPIKAELRMKRMADSTFPNDSTFFCQIRCEGRAGRGRARVL